MTPLERSIISVLNNWHENLNPIDENTAVDYEFNKKKFQDRYTAQTGEFLKITKRLETQLFSKICHGLSQNYVLDEALLDEYMDWCFENYGFFVRSRNGFNLNSIAIFASEWRQDFLKFEFESKPTINDLNDIVVKNNVFACFEKYGIPLSATKLLKEKECNKKILEVQILDRLQTQLYGKENMRRLKNMLRISVENGPYSSQIMFSDYKISLAGLFKYFSDEPWCPKC